jgi:acyl-CoA synthetase (NDP forming)
VLHLGIIGRMASVRQMIRSIQQVDPVMDRKFLDAIPGALVEFENRFTIHMVHLMEKSGKPILGVNLLPEENARTIMDVEGSLYKGVSFLTPERAVKALARMNTYRQWREREES